MNKTTSKCSSHTDCHAFKRGGCIALSDTDFGGKNCPFYKTRTEHLKDRIAAAEKLRASGRIDLIEKYYKTVVLFEEMIEHDKAKLHDLIDD